MLANQGQKLNVQTDTGQMRAKNRTLTISLQHLIQEASPLVPTNSPAAQPLVSHIEIAVLLF